MNKAICIGWICLWLGMSIAKVGTLPKYPYEQFSWFIPFAMAVMLIVPALFGYLAGKEDSK